MQLVENRFEIENGIVKDQYSDMDFDIIEVSDKYMDAQFVPGFIPVYATYQKDGTTYGIIQKQELPPYMAVMDEKQIKRNFLPLLLGLKWLQEQDRIFGNLTPDKIYQIENGYALKDFGAGEYYEEKTPYTPYEYYTYHGCGNKASDVYSVCAIIYEALTGIFLPNADERLDVDMLEPLAAFGVSSPLCDIIEKGLSVLDCDRYQSIEELINCIYTEDEINACVNDWAIFVRPIKSNLSDVKDKIAREKRIIEEEKEEKITSPQTIDPSKKKKTIMMFAGICVVIIIVVALNATVFNKTQPEEIREIKMSPMPVSASGSAVSGSAVTGTSVTITPTVTPTAAPTTTSTIKPEPSNTPEITATIKPTPKPTPKPTKKPKKKKKTPKATPITIKTPKPRRTSKPVKPKPKIKIDKNISIE